VSSKLERSKRPIPVRKATPACPHMNSAPPAATARMRKTASDERDGGMDKSTGASVAAQAKRAQVGRGTARCSATECRSTSRRRAISPAELAWAARRTEPAVAPRLSAARNPSTTPMSE